MHSSRCAFVSRTASTEGDEPHWGPSAASGDAYGSCIVGESLGVARSESRELLEASYTLSFARAAELEDASWCPEGCSKGNFACMARGEDVRAPLVLRGAGGGRPHGDPGLGGLLLQARVKDPEEESAESAASVWDSRVDPCR